MSSSGSDPDLPQGGPQQGQPAWGAPPPPPPEGGYGPPAGGYGPPAGGYGPAPTYSGAPAGHGGAGAQRPTQVTAAAVIGIVWGALGALLGLIVTLGAFAVGAALAGLVILLATAVSVALVVAGLQALQGRSPRLLLLLSYVAIGLSLLQLVVALVAEGGDELSAIVGLIVPGVIVYLLQQPPSTQYYASRGIAY